MTKKVRNGPTKQSVAAIPDVFAELKKALESGPYAAQNKQVGVTLTVDSDIEKSELWQKIAQNKPDYVGSGDDILKYDGPSVFKSYDGPIELTDEMKKSLAGAKHVDPVMNAFYDYVVSKGINPAAVVVTQFPITDLSKSVGVTLLGNGLSKGIHRTAKVPGGAIAAGVGNEVYMQEMQKAFDSIVDEYKLHKAGPSLTIPKDPVEDEDGLFTSTGVAALTAYSNAWLQGVRDLEMERTYPDLAGPFYDVRSDPDYARRWADDVVVKSVDGGNLVVGADVKVSSLQKVLQATSFDAKHMKLVINDKG